MRHPGMKGAAAFLLSLLICAANAGEFQYECTVKQVLHADKGRAEPWQEDIVIGEKFTVSRDTGEIVGSPAFRLNRGQGWKTLEVLDRGSSQQSFKLLAVALPAPYTKVLYFEIMEFEQAPEKTFAYYNNFTLNVGVCK